MIYDRITNINIYKGLSPDIYEGLKYLRQISPDIAVGAHQINPRVKAIVSEYDTKKVNEHGFEAHKKNIDIQYLLQGEERISSMPIERLTLTQPYSEANDAAFYSSEGVRAQEITIGDGYFAVFFPQDGHMPQLSVDEPMMVKKIVVKVEANTQNFIHQSSLI
ncbi:MAG: YhcH/YjgK/YiaL family protein [Bacteroidales bacterium]|nr:YhcH/YjgK/YiaL family protein [Bacteroidales bacterium]